MGWKAVKEHYRIGHTVHLRTDGLCIGSTFVSELIVVSREGQIIKGYGRGNEDLERYQNEIGAAPARFIELLDSPDTFARDLRVYSYRGAEIREQFCEEVGFPNITHDGELMYDNSHYLDKADAVLHAKKNAASAVRSMTRHVASIEADLAKARADLASCEEDVVTLATAYPDVPAAAGEQQEN